MLETVMEPRRQYLKALPMRLYVIFSHIESVW